ncbi:DUF305 domain-containing protein [Paenarthrobacter ureafaciens]|nr:DUF305 domain-containing protein [Paenarthrobacter ureafaciens]
MKDCSVKTKKLIPLSAVALVVSLALAGCSTGTPGSSGTSMPGMDHGNMGSSSAPAQSAPASAGDHNAADAMFAQAMIPHHAQAVEMSGMILAKQDIPAQVSALATRIKDAQGPEIETMTDWLKGWNESTMMPSGHSMDGMMSDDDMAKLDAAQGTEAAKLFLSQMIAHHRGAVAMAETQTREGKNTDAVKLAKEIITAQEAEIKEMEQLLAGL